MEAQELRTWIDIDLDKLRENYFTACSLTRAKVTCVVKANAYGHGAVRIAEELAGAGCSSFAVSCADEALELRQAGIGGEILVMTPAERKDLETLIAGGITLTAASAEDLRDADRAARRLGRTVQVHIKLDTGFHRLGFPCVRESASEIASVLRGMETVRAEGLYSHLGLVTPARDEKQHERFIQMRDWLAAEGVTFTDLHLCDSIGLVRYPAWHMSRCRVGAFLYGVRPSGSEQLPFRCEETLALRTRVTAVREIPAGEVVGYDDAVTDRPVRVATIAAGYGDGYPRHLSHGRGQVCIRGRRAPVIGLVCMDQMMADVSGIPDCAPGDTATLLGDGIPYGEIADWAQTNRNECLTILSRRPVRVYHRGGGIVTVTNGLLGTREDH